MPSLLNELALLATASRRGLFSDLGFFTAAHALCETSWHFPPSEPWPNAWLCGPPVPLPDYGNGQRQLQLRDLLSCRCCPDVTHFVCFLSLHSFTNLTSMKRRTLDLAGPSVGSEPALIELQHLCVTPNVGLLDCKSLACSLKSVGPSRGLSTHKGRGTGLPAHAAVD